VYPKKTPALHFQISSRLEDQYSLHAVTIQHKFAFFSGCSCSAKYGGGSGILDLSSCTPGYVRCGDLRSDGQACCRKS
jgi:hypothetical protein